MTDTETRTVDTKTVNTYNLSIKKGRAAARAALDAESKIEDEDRGTRPIGDLQTYILIGTPELVYRDTVIVENNDGNRYAIKNGAIHSISSGRWVSGEESLRDLVDDPTLMSKRIKGGVDLSCPDGIVMPTSLTTNEGGAVLTVLQNGDEDNNTLVDDFQGFNFPTVSFRCLGRFYNEEDDTKGISMMAKAIASGDLRVVDFTPDDSRDMTPEDMAADKAFWKYRENVVAMRKPKEVVLPPMPPERGFTAMNDRWHRSATVLMHDKAKRMTLILGQDEGSYFGCEIPGTPKTVADAFTALIPKDLRDRGELLRQGEWFFIPVDETEIPSMTGATVHLEEFALPVEHESSNQHRVRCADGRVAKDGSIYALNPSMEHEDHATTEALGWHTFRRNTAKRSFSEGGVD